jgi:Flp pilus assembly protein TadG
MSIYSHVLKGSRRQRRAAEQGIATMIFLLSLLVLAGMMSLILDVGWGYYTSKKAQAAADAAVLAGLSQALSTNGPDATPNCGTLPCQAAMACPASGALQTACAYAAAVGFTDGGEQGRQTVKVSAGTTSPAPGAPNVPADYWLQVSTGQNLPQWFSALISSTGLNPRVTATGVLRRTNLNASVYLLNRHSDCFASALGVGVVCGEDFLALGTNTLNAGGGIYMSSSNASGIGLPNIAAGTVAGVASVTAPFTYIMGSGGIQDTLGVGSWTTAPVNGFPDSDYFTDPFAGRSQPPAPTGLADHAVPGGVISGSLLSSSPTVLPPGNYYATLPILGTATGLPVTITGNVVFSDGAAKPCGGFCNYVFYGGVVTGALSSVTFSPGRYVFAGAQPVAGAAGIGFSAGANSVVKDLTPLVNGKITQNSDAGEIFIFTDKNYSGLTVPNAITQSGLSFPQVRAGIMAGVEPQITLHGLNSSSADLPAALSVYSPVLFWQDRANTTLKYTSTGLLDRTCGGVCTNTLSVPGSQEMILMGSQNGSNAGTNLFGTIYGPRLSWLTILGLLPGDRVAGPLQVITGALQMAVNSRMDVDPVPNPPTRLIAGLVQ